MRKVSEACGQRFPKYSEALFAELLAMPQSELLSLLAVCIGYTVSAMTSREGDRPAALLAQSVGLDIGQWGKPTGTGSFEHVSKAKALQAVQVFRAKRGAPARQAQEGTDRREAARLRWNAGRSAVAEVAFACRWQYSASAPVHGQRLDQHTRRSTAERARPPPRLVFRTDAKR
jgi:hypothetical protein